MSHANSDAQRWAQLVPATRPSNPSPASTGGAANAESAESARPSGIDRLIQNRAAEQARVLNGVSFEPGGAPYDHDWLPGMTSKRADQITAVAYGRSIDARKVENHNRTLIRTTLIVDIAPLAVNETKSEAVLTTLFGSERAKKDKEDHYTATYALATLGELRRRHLAGAWTIVCGEGHLDDADESEGRRLKEAQDVFFPLVEKWNLARTATFVGAHGEATALAIYHGNSIKSSPEKWPRCFFDSKDVVDAARLADVGAAKKPRVAAAPPASPGAVAAIAGIHNLDEAPPASPGTMARINAMLASEAGAAPAPAPSSPAAPPAAAPPPQSPANDAADEGMEPWTCSACFYSHVAAEAFFYCAACGAEKDPVFE